MSAVFELAAFTIRDGHGQALLDERPAMIAALRRAFPGLLSSWLSRRDDDRWVDVILWRTRQHAEYSAQHVTEVPEAVAWFSHIEQSYGVEHLTVITSETGPAR
jgi:antibiotic biosynthesis monooxygenase